MNTEDKFRQSHPQQEVPQYYHYPPNYQSQQTGREISLNELWRELIRYKWLIILITMVSTLGASYYASKLPTVYKSELLLTSTSSGVSGNDFSAGVGGNISGLAKMAGVKLGGNVSALRERQALARTKTRSFIVRFVDSYNLKPVLFAERWNQQKQEWLDGEPSDSEAFELFASMLTISTNEDLLTKITLEWKNPVSYVQMPNIANNLVVSINSLAKKEAESRSRKNILFLENELKKTDLITTKRILYKLVENQMWNVMLANASTGYLFKVLDPAIIPDRAERKPILNVVILGLVSGLIMGLLIATVVNYFGVRDRGV